MLIVSQDKEKIHNFNKAIYIEIITSNNAEELPTIVINYKNNCDTVGVYKNKKRAREVLQEIIKKYGEYAQITNPKTGIEGVYAIPKIYEMPEE